MPEPKPPKLEAAPAARSLRTAVLLAVGTELTVGETRDTNGGDLARPLAHTGTAIQLPKFFADDARRGELA